MAKQHYRIESNFKAVGEAAYEAVSAAREVWLETAKDTAESKVEGQAATRGYELQVGIEEERIGHQSARIYTTAFSERWGTNPWYLRFFEYGSVNIPAMPFIRPAARKANKAFVAAMGADFEGLVRRKARVRL